MNLGVNKNLNRQNTAINGNNSKVSNVNQVQAPKSKKSVIDDMEKLKQRREDRKKKNDDDKISKKEVYVNQEGSNKVCDQDFENLIKKKRLSVVIRPDQVSI